MKRRCEHGEGIRHNCSYVRHVNRMIPQAVKVAEMVALGEELKRGPLDDAEFDRVQTAAFHEAMFRLCEQWGRVRP